MIAIRKDLWSLALDPRTIDPHELTRAIEEQMRQGHLDFRTRLLIRDSAAALRERWGHAKYDDWLSKHSWRQEIEEIAEEDFGDELGFPSLRRRVMEPTTPGIIGQFLRDLSRHVQHPLKLYLGGSGAMILKGYLSRRTEDINVVDEVPSELRSQPQVLDELNQLYNLLLAHFQSHYLPSGWQNRVHSLLSLGLMQVYLVDVYDVFLSKLFSVRIKDRQDLQVLHPQLDKNTIVQKLKESTGPLLADQQLRTGAEHNWYVLFGEPLPTI